MLTLFHAPNSRSSRIIRVLHELGIQDQVDIKVVTIPRPDGSGCIDPSNPHVEGKVPLLLHNDCQIWESNAIILYLTDLFPSALAPVVGSSNRGSYLSWLAYYGNVVEPVLLHSLAEISHPILDNNFRGLPQVFERLSNVLEKQDYLLGAQYTAADLLLASPFSAVTELTPDIPAIKNWIERCQDRPSTAAVAAFDNEAGKETIPRSS